MLLLATLRTRSSCLEKSFYSQERTLPKTTFATHCLPVSLQRLKTIKGCLNVDTIVQLQRICEVYTKQHLLTVRLTPYPQIVIELSPNEGNCCIARRRTAVVGRLPPRLKKKSDTSRPQRFLVSKKGSYCANESSTLSCSSVFHPRPIGISLSASYFPK
jgi:hypothetical protein